MPCYDSQGADEDRYFREQHPKLTRLLCEACKLIESKGLANKVSSELANWAIEHKAMDAKRPSPFIVKTENIMGCVGGKITVAHVQDWLALLPEEFRRADLMASSNIGSPVTLKRILAFRFKENPSDVGVAVNGIGTHLPFDDSLTWEKVLTP